MNKEVQELFCLWDSGLYESSAQQVKTALLDFCDVKCQGIVLVVVWWQN